MNLSKYPTLHRDVPSAKPNGPVDATEQQRKAEAFYGKDWITPESLKAAWKAHDAKKDKADGTR